MAALLRLQMLRLLGVLLFHVRCLLLVPLLDLLMLLRLVVLLGSALILPLLLLLELLVLLILFCYQLFLLLLVSLIHFGIACAGRCGDLVLGELTRVRGRSGRTRCFCRMLVCHALFLLLFFHLGAAWAGARGDLVLRRLTRVRRSGGRTVFCAIGCRPGFPGIGGWVVWRSCFSCRNNAAAAERGGFFCCSNGRLALIG